MKRVPYPAYVSRRFLECNSNEAPPLPSRALKILRHPSVSLAFSRIYAQWTAAHQNEELDAKLEQFCEFVEDAALVPTRKPRGARWYSKEQECAEFFTPAEVIEYMEELKNVAELMRLKLKSNLCLFSNRDTMSSLIEQLLNELQGSYLADGNKNTVPELGRKDAPNSWRNYILEQLLTISDLRFQRQDGPYLKLATATLDALLTSPKYQPISDSYAREFVQEELGRLEHEL